MESARQYPRKISIRRSWDSGAFLLQANSLLPAMEKHFDTLRFELIDAREAKEPWTLEYYHPGEHAVIIYVNDKDLNALLVELEDKEDGVTSPTDPTEVYGHISLWLSRELEPKQAVSDGIYLSCCSVCGDADCWGVRAEVRENDDEVVWYSFGHEHRPYTYGGLEFHFERNAYYAQLKILEGWVKQYQH